MAEGFVLDWKGGVARDAATWMEGSHERTAFGNARLDGRAQIPLHGLRCEHCGFVELYAQKVPRKSS